MLRASGIRLQKVQISSRSSYALLSTRSGNHSDKISIRASSNGDCVVAHSSNNGVLINRFKSLKGDIALRHHSVRSYSTSASATATLTADKEVEKTATREESNRKLTAAFFLVIVLLTATIIHVGGLTRLTESGLSMTSWSLTGEKLPLSQHEWEEEFSRYKTFPEFERGRSDMTLSEFKTIFLYEYTHRMIGRLIGLVYFGFVGVMWKRGAFRQFRNLSRQTLLLGSLIGAQGLIGWWMVKSGLEDTEDALFNKYNTIARVSQYRLVTHLSMAITIYSLALWNFLEYKYKNVQWTNVSKTASPFSNRIKRLSPVVASLVYLTALSGGFVAGMDAGLIYNEFPKMGKGLVPEEYWNLTPKWLNFFENPASAQFNHRLLATFTATTVLIFSHYAMRGKMFLPPPLRFALAAMGVVATLQYLLGLATLLSHVHLHSAASHQMGSLALITFSLSAVKLARRLPK